ncbi:MAG: tyrosine-type recombinase/integrase [Acidimicrobiales bacterium]
MVDRASFDSGFRPERHGKGWRYRVELPRAETGRRRYSTKAGFGTEGDARRALNRVLVDIDDGVHVDRNDVTVGEYLDEWLDRAAVDLRATTMVGYRRSAGLIAEEIGGVRLQRLTPLAVEKAYVRLIDEGRARKTARNAHGVLRRALGDAERLGLVNRNAAAAAKAPSDVKAEWPTWTPDELSSFLRSAADDPLYAAMVLFATTGLRRSEVCGLRWDNVDLETAELFVVTTRTTAGPIVIDGTTKTPKSRRRVSLDKATVGVLRAHKTEQTNVRLALGPVWVGDGHVFTLDDGRPLHPDQLSKTFRRLADRCDLPRIRLHDLRHTYATIGLRAGVHPKVMSERLVHATVGVTLDLYSHVAPALDRDAAEEVASLLDYAAPESADGRSTTGDSV